MTRKNIRPLGWPIMLVVALFLNTFSLFAAEKVELDLPPTVTLVSQSTEYVSGKTIFKWHVQVANHPEDPKKIRVTFPGTTGNVKRYASFVPYSSWSNSTWYNSTNDGSNYWYDNSNGNSNRDGDEDGNDGGNDNNGCHYVQWKENVSQIGETGKLNFYMAAVLTGNFVYYNAPISEAPFKFYDDENDVTPFASRVPIPTTDTVEASFCTSKNLSDYNTGLTNPVWYDNSGNALSSSTVTNSGSYWVVYGNCPNKVAKVYNITINTIPSVISVTGAENCGTGSLNLSATASAGTINWYAASTGGSSLGSGTSFTTGTISATTSYWVDATSNGCTTAARTEVVATIKTIPTITGVVGAENCGAGSLNLSATASAGTINWYAASSGGSSLGTGTSFNTGSISTTTSYWVDATNDGCTTADRTEVVATINPIPSIAGVTGGSNCGAGTVALSATADFGTIHWYDAAAGGNALGTGTSFTTLSINSTTSYWVEAVSDQGCVSTARSEVVATIKTIPTITSVTGAERCGTGTVTLLANASAGTISWYTDVEGGDLVGTGNSFTTPSLTSTTTYYVEVTHDGCTSTSRTAVVATIKTCVYYTYTQNYYGDDDDACIEGTRYAKAINLMTASIPGVGIVIGNQPANKSFKVMPSDVIKLNKLFKFEGSNRALRGNYTVNTSRNNLNNGLLGEAMALALNLRIPIQGARLAGFSLDGAGGKCIVTQSIPNSCGNSGGHDDDDDDDDDDDHDRSRSSSNNLRYYSLPASVINALPVKTVQGLYDYASSILGGANTTVSLTELERTLSSINSAFSQGRLFVKFDATCGGDDEDDDDDEDCNRSVTGRSAIADEQATSPAAVALGISAYPNPYRDRVTFRIALAQTAKASLMLYDMNGQLVARLFDGELPAMTTKFIEYTIPVSKRRNLVYVLRSGNTVQTGQLIR